MNDQNHSHSGATERPQEPLTVSPRQAAKLIGCGASTIYQLVREGQLRCLRLGAKGTHIRIPRVEIERLVAAAAPASEGG